MAAPDDYSTAPRPIPRIRPAVTREDFDALREDLAAEFEAIDARFTVIERALASVIESQEDLITALTGDDPLADDGVPTVEIPTGIPNVDDTEYTDDEVDAIEAQREAEELRQAAAEAANEESVD